jgi:hypothetical protein
MPDDPGVLGNLPRSRPGRRSDKRTAGKPAAKARTTAARQGAKPRSSSSRAKGSAPPRRAQRSTLRAQPSRAGGDDPIAGAIRLAGRAATLPLKVAGEVIKRLPGR